MSIKVLGVHSVPLIHGQMTVAAIAATKEKFLVYSAGGRAAGFCIQLPLNLEGKINLGDTVIFLCIPNGNLRNSYETMAVTKKVVRGKQVEYICLWTASPYWSDRFSPLELI